jgi:hexokinase
MAIPIMAIPVTDSTGRRAGSFADVPPDLMAQIERLEELFTADTEKLKEMTDHFVSELQRGLTVEGGDIVRNSGFSLAQC